MSKREPYLGNPQATIAVLNKYGFTFQKKFGQNFLIDPHVLDKIIRAGRSQRMILFWRSDRVWER